MFLIALDIFCLQSKASGDICSLSQTCSSLSLKFRNIHLFLSFICKHISKIYITVTVFQNRDVTRIRHIHITIQTKICKFLCKNNKNSTISYTYFSHVLIFRMKDGKHVICIMSQKSVRNLQQKFKCALAITIF